MRFKAALATVVLAIGIGGLAETAHATQYTQINEYVIGGVAGMPVVTAGAGSCYQYNSNGSCAKYAGTVTVTNITFSGTNANRQFSECTVTLTGVWSSASNSPFTSGAIWLMYDNNGLGTDNQNGNAACQPSPYNNVLSVPGTLTTWTSPNYPQWGESGSYDNVANFTVKLSSGNFPPYGTSQQISLSIASAVYNAQGQQGPNPCMEQTPVGTSGQLSYNTTTGVVTAAGWDWFLALSTPGCSGLPNS